MDRSNRPDWRKPGRRTSPHRDPQTREHSSKWQQRRVDAVQTATFRHRLRMIALTLGALTMIVAFAVIVLFIPRQTPIISLTVWQYGPGWPPNRYAAEDLRRLQQSDAPNQNLRILADDFRGSISSQAALQYLEDQLDRVSPGGPNKNTVIVYLSAHGVVNEANEPCLLFSDAEPLDSSTWLPFSQVLELFQRDQANSSRAARRVLLILDSGRIDQRWNAGLLYNAFAEQLEASVARADVLGLYVLTACGPGQTAWASPEMDGTAFGFFVTRGLNGDAAGGDNVVTMLELYRYVQRNVGIWSQNYRAAIQQPMLIPEIADNEDFGLVYRYKGRDLGLLPDAQQQADRLQHFRTGRQQIVRLWQQAEQILANRHLTRNDPLGLADLQHRLLRADELLWAGSAYQAEWNDLLRSIQVQLKTAGATPLPSGVRGWSLPLAMQIHPPEEDQTTRARILAAWQSAGGRPKPKEDEPPLPPPSHLAAARVGVDWLADLSQVSGDQLTEVLDWVRSAPRQSGSPAGATEPPLEVTEIQLLGMLRAHVDWQAAAQGVPLGRNVARLIAARRVAEQVAAPEDPRVHWWIQKLVEATDAKRRRAEDLLYLGSQDAVARAGQILDALLSESDDEGSYRQVLQRAETVAAYYEVHDAAWAELPYLVRAAATRLKLGPTDQVGGDPQQAWDRSLRLVEATHRFSAELDRCLIELGGVPSPGLTEVADEVKTLHGELREGYRQYCGYLERQAGHDRPTLLRIGHVLRIPLLDVEQRERLSDKYRQILFSQIDLREIEQSASDAGRPGLDANAVADHQRRVDQYRDRLAACDPHPVLMLLDRREMNLLPEQRTDFQRSRQAASSGDAWLARQGGHVREMHSELMAKLNELDAIAKKRLEQAVETPANIRAGLSQADRLARAAAPLLGARTWVQTGMDPAHRLRLVDLHFAMRWHTWRALEDFWGAADEAPGTPYFAQVADAYLASARLLDKTPRQFLYAGTDLTTLLELRRRAAQETQLSVQNALSLRTDATVPHQLQVHWHAGVPEGVAAAFVARPTLPPAPAALLPVRDATGQATLRRAPLRVTGGGETADTAYRIPLEDLQAPRAGADLDGVGLYRGHLYRQRFRILWPPWVTRVAVPPRNPPTASITVEGEGQKTGHIMFIFDCSGSMNERGRMPAAKTSMQAILRSLEAAGHYEVGLRVYGRRARFTDPRDCAKKAFASPEYEGEVHPDLDVELIAPVQTLDKEHYQSLLNKIGDVQPFGQTPLYLSLKTAFDEGDFEHVPQGEPKRLIVITDGLNFQTNCLRIENRPERLTQMQEVLKTRNADPKSREVQIDIIGFDMEETRDQLTELIHLAERTGGKYHDAKNTKDLTDALRESLNLVEYRVIGPNASTAGRTRRELGELWPLPELPPTPTQYEVQLPDLVGQPHTTVQIEGGEALLLRYDPRRNRLVYPAYEPKQYDRRDDHRGDVQICEAPDGSGSYRVQTLLPRRMVRDVEFYVSIQQQDEQQFTYRPKHIWAEIRPVGSDSPQIYYFTDPDFVPDRPVPVLRFLAKDWPDMVEEGEIRLWFKTDPDGAPPEWNGPAVDPARPESFELNALPGVTFQIDRQVFGGGASGVIVSQRHPMDRPVSPARVRIYPPPDELIYHEFAAVVNVVKHEFRYAQPTLATVDITPKQKIVDGAMEVPAMRVVVPR